MWKIYRRRMAIVHLDFWTRWTKNKKNVNIKGNNIRLLHIQNNQCKYTKRVPLSHISTKFYKIILNTIFYALWINIHEYCYSRTHNSCSSLFQVMYIPPILSPPKNNFLYIIYMLYDYFFKLLNDCCLTSSFQYFSYIHDQNKLTNNILCT